MNIYGKLLVACVLQTNVWGTAAFVTQKSKGFAFRGTDGLSPTVSYLDSNGKGSYMASSKLASSEGSTQGEGVMDNSQSRGPSSSSPASVLDARLTALEQQQNRGAQGGGRPQNQPRKLWDSRSAVIVQGGSLKTWSFPNPSVERVQVVMNTEGRPLDADIELWQGPDNTPFKMRVYVEDGSLRPFRAVIETPRGPNTIAIRNTGHLEFPLAAYVMAGSADNGFVAKTTEETIPRVIQGGALRTYPFDPTVESVQVALRTDGRPLNVRIELLQGPNNNKQVMELYTEDGMDRPFFCVIETPGSGNVVRVVNTATMEFPMTALVEAYQVSNGNSASNPVIGGGSGYMDRAW
mmetsp:Transcript_92902/g.248594  ORF Transcript_92902/g.248594 Transcript_92902/m.248594 type:complete len:350 (+) Transcript_92902:66-1115(+)